MENKYQLIIICLGIILISLLVYPTSNKSVEDYSEENYLLLTLMKTDADVSKVYVDSQKAESYYAEASFAYEDRDYNSVESNCRLARDYYSEGSQSYNRIKAELKATGIEDKLVELYIEELELSSEISLNMFEVCEHFESASRYYYKYYNTDISSDDPSYDMGNGEINMMNEKIMEHDKNIRDYNDKIEEYRIELKLRINTYSEDLE